MRPGRSAADEASEGKAGHNKGLRQFSRQVRMTRGEGGGGDNGAEGHGAAFTSGVRTILTAPLSAPPPPRPSQVWMKVMEKQKTNYNEVADELVQEFREEAAQVRIQQGLPPTPGPGELVDDSRRDNPNLDERNVRRRVYDALNVLIALGIIVKQKKVRGLGGVATHGVRERVGAESAARWRARAALADIAVTALVPLPKS